MSNTTQQSKDFLMQALHTLPDDFSLTETRSYIKKALNELEYVQTKKIRRQDNIKKEETKKIAANNNFRNPQDILNLIDKMIEEENNKIDKIKKPKNQDKEDEFLFG